MSKFKELLIINLIILIFFILGICFYEWESYKIRLYKTKYPGTTTVDYWLDSHR